MHLSKVFTALIAAFFVLVATGARAQDSDDWEFSTADEGTCICGLDKELLRQIEAIVKAAGALPSASCEASDGNSGGNQPEEGRDNGHSDAVEENATLETKDEPASIIPTAMEEPAGEHIHTHSNEVSSGGVHPSMVDNLVAEIHRLEAQVIALAHQTSSNAQTIENIQSVTGASNNNDDDDDDEDEDTVDEKLTDEFADNLAIGPNEPHNDALAKLNSTQRVDPQEVADALESAVPNVVSTIFSNIQNLTMATEHSIMHQHQSNSGGGDADSGSHTLTSIDGNSVVLSASSTADILAEGEKLFIVWIEHQLQGLHLTASATNYIRKNAINLFRRIVRQYVERVERLGGSLQDNVRRATQTALKNTQVLVQFLLRNYISFAGGMMQIIGEQVSRVGKQIDSTGDTIAHLSLNPFDIVSDVIESLPNPSDYSKYFRNFGKQIMSTLTGSSNSNSNAGGQSSDVAETSNQPQTQQTKPAKPNEPEEQQQQQQQQQQQPSRGGGMFAKTMGALGKTVSSWVG